MTRASRGSRRVVPRERRTAIDVSLVAKRVPSFPVVSRFNFAEIEKWRQDRKAAGKRVGWNAILAHSYGVICQENPQLRDVFVARPFPYIYQHPEPIATLTIHRLDSAAKPRLIWARIASPGSLSLEEIQSRIDYFSKAPIEDVFKDGLRLERRLHLVRRLNWYLLMRWCGRKRAKHLGTFSISSLGHLGALNLHHPLVTATSLAMGPIDPNGSCDLALVCDHRVLDGVLASEMLMKLERVISELVCNN